MEINRKEFKRAARAHMRSARPGVMKVSLLYLLLATGLSTVINFVVANPAESIYRTAYAALNGANYERILEILSSTGGSWSFGLLVLNVLLFLYGVALSFGYTIYTLRRTDGEAVGTGTLLSGFAQIVPSVVLTLVIAVLTLAWACLVLMPVVVAGAAVTMAFAVGFSFSTAAMVASMAIVYVMAIAALFVLQYLTGRYLVAPYILADEPEIGGLEAVRRSRAFLRGRLGEVFKLQLSFLGWDILGGLIVLVVGAASMGGVVALYVSGQDPLILGGGAYAVVILTTLAEILFQMWFLPYREGTFALYYRSLSPRAVSQADLESGRPEPF